ncbi:MAG TPA: NAD(P)-binding domain-containing protein [Candidatus Polarisedimenticolaceae bacterium]|nr:NAD(P)-binding domain-containing protein [Candidatus Polarisedimenticolaceae bacterium]
MNEKIGILGSGDVAQTLARGFKKKGYDVRIGTRDPEKLSSFSREAGVPAGTFQAVADHGEILVLAVKGAAAAAVLEMAGGAVSGKVVIDTTNPIADAPPDQGILRYFTEPNRSLMETLQEKHPKARLVKAFNSVGHALMVDPKLPGGPPTMFYCGNDAEAKAVVAHLIEELGWIPEDLGGAPGARALEPLCQLWCAPGFLRNQWSHAFKVLR